MRSHSIRLTAIAALFSLLQSGAFAAEAISTDRPDFVESSDVVGTSRFQIEFGVQSERDTFGGVKTRTRTTPTLLRFGLGESLELRVETDGRTTSRVQDAIGVQSSERGWADASIGLKWHMADGDEAKGLPGMAWLVHLDGDTGSAAFRGQGWRPSLRFVAEWDLPNDVSVGVMPGVAASANPAGKRFAAGILAVTVGKAWTPAWRSYVELAGQQIASSANGGSVVTFDTGVTYLVNDALQLDLSLARGLTRESPRFAWGLGASVRF